MKPIGWLRFKRPLVDFSYPRNYTAFLWLMEREMEFAIRDVAADLNRAIYA